MLKFEYYYQEDKFLAIKPNTLYIRQPGTPRQLITQTFEGNYGAKGFILEPSNHWITFKVYPDRIKVFYKQVETPNSTDFWTPDMQWEGGVPSQVITYYQKELEISNIKDFSVKNALYLPKQNPLIFTFTKKDQVHKVEGVWIKKSN